MLHWLLDEKFLSKLNTVVTNTKDTDKCYTQSGIFSGQRNSLRVSPF